MMGLSRVRAENLRPGTLLWLRVGQDASPAFWQVQENYALDNASRLLHLARVGVEGTLFSIAKTGLLFDVTTGASMNRWLAEQDPQQARGGEREAA